MRYIKRIRRLDGFEDGESSARNREVKTRQRSLNLERKATDPVYLQSLVDAKKLVPEDRDMILNMATILEDVYPGLWDIQVNIKLYKIVFVCENATYAAETTYEETVYDELYNFRLIIKFPYINIRNTTNERTLRERGTHDIHDIFVMFKWDKPMSSDYFKFGSTMTEAEIMANPEVTIEGYIMDVPKLKMEYSMYGMRGSLTVAEYQAGYLHSHLNSQGSNSYVPRMFERGFCMGDGEIRNIILMLQNEYNPDIFIMLLHMIKNFLEWESLSGTPFIMFKSVFEGKPLGDEPPTLSIDVIAWYANSLKRYWKNQIDAGNPPPKLTWSFDYNGNYCIQHDDYLKGFTAPYRRYTDFIGSGGGEYDSVVLWSNDNGEYFNCNSFTAQAVPANVSKETYIFRGEDHSLGIITKEVALPPEDGFFLHPTIEAFIKKKLENYANYKKIRADIARRASEAQNNQRYIGQDQLSVPGHIPSGVVGTTILQGQWVTTESGATYTSANGDFPNGQG